MLGLYRSDSIRKTQITFFYRHLRSGVSSFANFVVMVYMFSRCCFDVYAVLVSVWVYLPGNPRLVDFLGPRDSIFERQFPTTRFVTVQLFSLPPQC